MKKNPWVAAFLNVILTGAGYLYAGKKTAFGALLLIGEVLMYFAIIQNPEYIDLMNSFYLMIASIIWLIAFGYDAYMEVKGK